MASIAIFKSSEPGERRLKVSSVTVHAMQMDKEGKPYMLFEHKDFPLGALRAEFDGEDWACDLDDLD